MKNLTTLLLTLIIIFGIGYHIVKLDEAFDSGYDAGKIAAQKNCESQLKQSFDLGFEEGKNYEQQKLRDTLLKQEILFTAKINELEDYILTLEDSIIILKRNVLQKQLLRSYINNPKTEVEGFDNQNQQEVSFCHQNTVKPILVYVLVFMAFLITSLFVIRYRQPRQQRRKWS